MRDFLGIFKNRIVIFIGMLILILGCMVIAGWHLKNTALIQIHPAFAPMQYNTALAFILSGLGLMGLGTNHKRISLIAGTAICALGFLTVLQYIFSIDIGLDQLFIKHYITTKTSHPGRMAPNTAICFMLLGITIAADALMKGKLRRYTILKNLSTLILLIGVTSLAGYLIQLEITYDWEMLTRMALHTAAGFILLSLGLLVRLWSGEARQNDHWLSTITSLAVLCATIILWQQIAKKEIDPAKKNIIEEQKLIVDNARNEFHSKILALNRMKERWDISNGTPRTEWQHDAENYVQDQPGLNAVLFMPPDASQLWFAPQKQKEEYSEAIEDITNHLKEIKKQDNTSENIFSFVPNNRENKNRLIYVFFPVKLDRNSTGHIIGVFDVIDLFKKLFPATQIKDYYISASLNNKYLFSSQNNIDEHLLNLKYSSLIDLYNLQITLNIWPGERKLKADQSSLPDIVLFCGVAFATLLGISINFSQQSYVMARRFRESEHRMTLILNNIGEGVFGLDKRGNIIFANKAIEKMLGYSMEDMLNKSQHDLIHHHYPDNSVYPKEKSLINTTLQLGMEINEDSEVFWKKDGTSLPVEYTSRPILGENNQITGAVVVFRDITQRQQAEEEQQQLIAKLARSNEELDEFAHIASHDLKEPLRAIHNHSRFLLEDYEEKLDEDGVKKLNRLISLTKRMEKLISDLLYYSRLGREKLAIKKTDLNEVIADLKDTLQDTLEEKNASIIVPHHLPTITCDTVRVTELFRNLITNAIKYNDNDEKVIEIGTRVIEEIIFRSSATKETILYVKDNGIGIDEEFHKDVFRIFKRLHNEKKYGEGSGSGLTFVKKIVNQHGGKIWINSQDEGGTTFFFTLSGAET